MDYKRKCCALKLLPLHKQLLLNKCVLMRKVVHGKAPQYLKDLVIPSERLHVHGNKQLLPRTRTDIFNTSFSFSVSLAWNNLPHHLRYPVEIKTSKRKRFTHSLTHTCVFSIARHLDTKCIFSLLRVLVKFHICISHRNQLLMYVFSCVVLLFHFLCGDHFNALCTVCECIRLTSILTRYSLFCRFPLFV